MNSWHRWWRNLRRWWRGWSTVVIAVVVCTVLALLGLIGGGREQPFRGERYDRKQIVIQPVVPDGVRITEVVDFDFGYIERHGYERILPPDAGYPSEVVATSTANADVSVTQLKDFDTVEGYQIRVGSADEVWRGHQRYTLSYTLPQAGIASGELNLDVVGTDDLLVTDHLDVWMVGFDLDEINCHTGRWSTTEGCEFERVDDGYVARIENLQARNGVTVDSGLPQPGGIVANGPVVQPRLVGPVDTSRIHWPAALAVLLAGLLTIAVLFLIRYLLGVDRVAEGGPMAAAFPDELAESLDTDPAVARSRAIGRLQHKLNNDAQQDEKAADVGTDLVTSEGLTEMAATEFAPPPGVRPWQAAIVMNEAVDDRSIRAWFSEMIAVGALVPVLTDDEESSSVRRLHAGSPETIDKLSEFDRELVGSVVATSNVLQSGRSSTVMANVWQRLADEQDRFVRSSRWWRQRPPQFQAAPLRRANWSVISFLLVIYTVIAWAAGQSFIAPLVPIGFLLSPLPIAIALVVVWILWASSARASDAPSRSTLGSAVAIRVLGFRKFLLGSEGAHVDAAWDRSRIREYSAWAIALDAAEAWSEQIESPTLTTPQFNMLAAVGDLLSKIDIDLPAYDTDYYRNRSNPWRATAQIIELAAEQMGEANKQNRSRGFFSSSGGSSSRSSSRGVGSGRGGGRSGSW